MTRAPEDVIANLRANNELLRKQLGETNAMMLAYKEAAEYYAKLNVENDYRALKAEEALRTLLQLPGKEPQDDAG